MLPPGSYTLNRYWTTLTTVKSHFIQRICIVNDTDGQLPLSDQSSDLINQCVDGTNGLIQLAASGGAPAGFDIKWEFVPSVTSQTFELTGAAKRFPILCSGRHVPTWLQYNGGLYILFI